MVAIAAAGVLVAHAPRRASPPPCVTSRERVTVRGDSLGTLAPPGTPLELWAGVYACTEPRRGEWVALELQGREVPLAKIIHALPGDSFEVETAPGGFFLRVNGVRLRNSRGEEFRLDATGWRLLRHLAELTGGKVPEGDYLVLGDLASSTVDSRAFGLIARSEFLGRLVPVR